jgi:peptide/nickel transport system substrate-binding protein
LPQRIERAEVTMQSGLPVTKTYDWVDLTFEDEITVPGDAWVDWDVENEVFLTADEVYPDGLTAVTKSIVYYPEDLYDVTWHDGSNLSVGDFIMPLIMEFELGLEGSDIFDTASAAQHESFMASFKGVRFVSTDPLVIEYYTDLWQLDAENNVTTMWPFYGQYDSSWHQIAVMNLAEASGELAYTNVKADELEIEQTNVLGGPSLEILNAKLDEAIAETLIPYETVLGEYVTAEEAAARYANMKAFYEEHEHFMYGSGPYILDEVFLVEKTATLVHNPNYPDLADKWAIFAEPKIAELAVDGAGRVPAGAEATFDAFVTFHGDPYPADEIDEVKYLLFGPDGELMESGVAELVADGQYSVTLSEETTSGFEAGAYKLEVIVVAIPVAIPTFSTFEFVSE